MIFYKKKKKEKKSAGGWLKESKERKSVNMASFRQSIMLTAPFHSSQRRQRGISARTTNYNNYISFFLL